MLREVLPHNLVHIRYKDHVLYHRMDPLILEPQVRECVGWLLRDERDFIVVAWDREAGPVSLNKGDAGASGLVILRSDILGLKSLGLCFSRPPLLRDKK